MIRICHPLYQPLSISSSKVKLTADPLLKNLLFFFTLHQLIHSLSKTVPKINSQSTKPISKLSLLLITKSPLNPAYFSKAVKLSSTMEKIKKSLDVIFTLKPLLSMLKAINQQKSKISKSDFHLLQLMDLSQYFHLPEDFSEEWKSLKFIRKPVERKLQLIFWPLFQSLSKIKNNKRKLKIIQFFPLPLNHWIQTQPKFFTIYLDLLIKKSFWDYWSRSPWKTKPAKKLSEWWLFQLMLRTMKHSMSERKGNLFNKFRYERNEIQELLTEYEAREERMKVW